MQDAGIMLAAFQFFRHMHDAGSDIDQVSLTANKRPDTVWDQTVGFQVRQMAIVDRE